MPVRQFKIETLDDLKYWTATQGRCVQTCLITGLIKAQATCVCSHNVKIMNKLKGRYKLEEGYFHFCDDCKTDRSLRKKTSFEKSPKTLSNWIDLLLTFSLDSDVAKGSRSSSFARKRGGHQYSRFRRCCGSFLNDDFDALG